MEKKYDQFEGSIRFFEKREQQQQQKKQRFDSKFSNNTNIGRKRNEK